MAFEKHKSTATIIENFATFSEILEHTATTNPENIFLIQNDKRYNYHKFNKLVNLCSNFFQELNLNSGDIVSFILPNSIDYLIIYFAAIRSRIILNPFPYHLNAEEVISKIETINPGVVFCQEPHFKQLSKSRFNVVNIEDLAGRSFVDFLVKTQSVDFSKISVNRESVAVLYYSSGTTGNQKIIEYSHRSMVLTQASMLRASFTEFNSVHLCVLPLGHTAAIRYTIKQCICTASTVVLYNSFWKLRNNLWDDIKKYGATFMEVVPSILIAILNTPYKNFNVEKIRSMNFIGCGSAFLPKNVQDSFEEKFSIPIANLYGLSETGATHFDDPRKPGRKTGNIGIPFDLFDVKIFDQDGNEISDESMGEIGIRGPGLLKGYFFNEELFKSSFNKDYFMTGDLGYRDNQGIYYYVDRKKDIIIKGGVNINPSEIDEVLQSHPEIIEAATIGKPDAFMGETIKSYVVTRFGKEIDPKTLKIFCQKKLGDFKLPSEFEFLESLPKGPSGKILKRVLRTKEVNEIRFEK